MRACMREWVRECVCACVGAWACVCVCGRVGVRGRVCAWACIFSGNDIDLKGNFNNRKYKKTKYVKPRPARRPWLNMLHNK